MQSSNTSWWLVLIQSVNTTMLTCRCNWPKSRWLLMGCDDWPVSPDAVSWHQRITKFHATPYDWKSRHFPTGARNSIAADDRWWWISIHFGAALTRFSLRFDSSRVLALCRFPLVDDIRSALCTSLNHIYEYDDIVDPQWSLISCLFCLFRPSETYLT